MKQRLAVLGGTLISTGGNLAEYVIGLFVSIVIARTLGPADFGIFSYAIWLCGTMFFFANNGVPVTTIRFTAEARGRGDLTTARAIGASLGRVQLMCLAIVLVGFVSIALIVEPDHWGAAAPTFLALIVVSAMAKSRYAFLVGVAVRVVEVMLRDVVLDDVVRRFGPRQQAVVGGILFPEQGAHGQGDVAGLDRNPFVDAGATGHERGRRDGFVLEEWF